MAKIKRYEQAAKKVMKVVNQHFKKDGWDLRFAFLVDDVFYQANGHNLEDYLFPKLLKERGLVVKDGSLFVTKKIPKGSSLNKFAKGLKKRAKHV